VEINNQNQMSQSLRQIRPPSVSIYLTTHMIDGDAVVLDASDRSSFGRLTALKASGAREAITYVFDLLFCRRARYPRLAA